MQPLILNKSKLIPYKFKTYKFGANAKLYITNDNPAALILTFYYKSTVFKFLALINPSAISLAYVSLILTVLKNNSYKCFKLVTTLPKLLEQFPLDNNLFYEN